MQDYSEKQTLVWDRKAYFVVIGFVILAGTGRALLGSLWQPLNMAFFGLAGLIAFTNLRSLVNLLWKSPIITLFIMLAVISILWSDIPSATIIRSIGLVLTTLFIAYVVTHYTLKDTLQILMVNAIILVIATIIFLIVFPSLSNVRTTFWQGAFDHKGILGQNMSICALVCLIVPLSSRKWHITRFIIYILSVFFVIKSNSVTSFLIVIAITSGYFLLRLFQANRFLFFTMIIAFIVPGLIVSIGFITNTDTIIEMLGRDPKGLTGRSDLWDRLPIAMSQRPWLGYGYSGFWHNWDGVYGTLWSRMSDHWLAGSAHQAFLDVRLQLGLIGFTLFIINMVFAVVGAVSQAWNRHEPQFLWPPLYLAWAIILGSVGSFALYIDLTWSLYVMTIFQLGQIFYDYQKSLMESQQRSFHLELSR